MATAGRAEPAYHVIRQWPDSIALASGLSLVPLSQCPARVTITEQQRQEMLEATKPLMQWLNENCHPHCHAVVGQAHIYRKQAAEAERQARKPTLKTTRLPGSVSLKSWMTMIGPRRDPTIETFDEKIKRLGTGQEIAKEEQ
jgi:hypothetical protein